MSAATKETKKYYATGRRKSAVARVWLEEGESGFEVDGKPLEANNFTPIQIMLIRQPLEESKTINQFKVKATLNGGGLSGQAGALQLGISRALVEWNPDLKASLRKFGFLTRDPREKERKKFGQKGARRKFQFVKR